MVTTKRFTHFTNIHKTKRNAVKKKAKRKKNELTQKERWTDSSIVFAEDKYCPNQALIQQKRTLFLTHQQHSMTF